MPQGHIFEIEMPNGKILEIDAPKDTPPEQIKAKAAKWWATQGALESQKANYASSQERGMGGAGVSAAPNNLFDKASQAVNDFDTGGAKAIGDFIQTGGQWVQSMAGSPVTAGRTTSTGRDVFAPTNTAQQVGNVAGKVGIGIAGGMAGGPTLAGGVTAGGLSGAMQNPDAPGLPAALGMAVPMAGAAIAALPSSKRAGAALEEIKRMASNRNVDTSKAQAIVDRAKQLGRTGSEPPPVIKKFDTRVMGTKGQGNPPLTYEESFDFASKAKKLSAADKFAMDAPMGAQVDKFAAALQTANREVATSIGKGKQFDAAMKEYRQAMKIKDAGELVKKYGPKALIGSGLLYAITQKYLD